MLNSIAGSAERGVRTGGRTLVASNFCAGSQDTDTSDQDVRRILQEVRRKELGLQEDVEQEEQVVKKAKKIKRCLAKDVDAAAREKMGLKPLEDVTAKRKATKEDKPKQPAKKKKFSTPKGQKKMTSFFMR